MAASMADGNRDKKPNLVPLDYEPKAAAGSPWPQFRAAGFLAQASVVLAVVSISLSVAFLAMGLDVDADAFRMRELGSVVDDAALVLFASPPLGIIFAIASRLTARSPRWARFGFAPSPLALGISGFVPFLTSVP
jgi:hypothetical protein